MITKRRFKMPLYGVPYDIYVVDTLEEAREIYKDYGEHFSAMVAYDDDYTNLRMIFRCGMASFAVTAHESVHLADKICLFLGIQADADNDEPLAYMVEYIFGRAIGVQDRHGVEV